MIVELNIKEPGSSFGSDPVLRKLSFRVDLYGVHLETKDGVVVVLNGNMGKFPVAETYDEVKEKITAAYSQARGK